MTRGDINKTLAANLRLIMASRGMNSSTLAQEAGLNATAVYDILSGKSRSPKLDTVAQLAAALGVDVVALITPIPEDTMRRAMLDAYSRLSPEERQKLLQVARAWADPPDH